MLTYDLLDDPFVGTISDIFRTDRVFRLCVFAHGYYGCKLLWNLFCNIDMSSVAFLWK